MPVFVASPLSVLSLLTSCFSSDDDVVGTPAGNDALQGAQPAPEPAVPPPADAVRSAAEYTEAIVCGRQGQGLFGATKVGEIYELVLTAEWFDAKDASLGFEAFIKRRGVDNSGERYFVDNWLGEGWQIVEISKDRVVVLNTCGFEEVLGTGGVPVKRKAPDPKVLEAARTKREEEKATVGHEDFGLVTQSFASPGGYTIDVHEDGKTLRQLNSEGLEQMTFRRIDEGPNAGLYGQWLNGARFGGDNMFSREQIITPEYTPK